VAAHHTMRRVQEVHGGDLAGGYDDLMTAHTNFHQSILAGCQRPRLMAIIQQLWDAAEIYRRWALAANVPRDTDHEHEALFEAVLAHDADGAVQALIFHISQTMAVVHESLDLGD
jgi:DNA-binding GntR family transcriptional regulator